MANKDEIINRLPAETRDTARLVWDTLGPEDQRSLLTLINSIPSQADLVKLLLRLSTQQVRAAFGQKSRVAIVGPANVGKSTLFNQFAEKSEHARVSALPGTTRTNQQADAGLFAIVDTPGADAVGEVGQNEQREALAAAAGADFLIIVFDAIQGIKQSELDLYQRLNALGKPHIVVLNKIDLVRREAKQVTAHAAASLGLETAQVIPIVARSGDGLAEILTAMAAVEPEIVSALGRALPQYRWQLAWRSIISSASLAAVIALTPLPVIDFAPLAITQAIMVLGIARIYNYRITLERARELVVTFGLGFLARTLFAELSKLGGIPGWVLAAAIAAATTVGMGYAAAIWFERGERLSNETLKQITQTLTSYFLDMLKGLGKRKPSREELQERIRTALEQSKFGKDPTIFHETPPDQSSETGR